MAQSGLQALDKWHKTRVGHLVFGLVELVISYGFFSWAINNGNLFMYLMGLVFLFGAGQNFVRIFYTHNAKK